MVKRAALIAVLAALAGCGGGDDREPAAPRSDGAETPADRARMDRAEFWALIEETREDDMSAHAERLTRRLAGLPPRQIVEFERNWRELDVQAYRWDIWSAAWVVHDGCSNDCFDYFRCGLIMLGERVFEDALRDPDSLADVDVDLAGDWEDACYAASDAYVRASGGKQLPQVGPPLPERPAGMKQQMSEEYKYVPELAEKYGY